MAPFDRAEAYKIAEELGFPVLKAWDHLSANVVQKMLRCMAIVTKEPYDHLTDAEVTVISTVISSKNGCEMWLSFHAAGLLKMEAMSAEDLTNLIAGGVPETALMAGANGRLKAIVQAAKVVSLHKGIILDRELEHLEALGIDTGDELCEILFVAGQVQGLNQIMPHYVNRGAPVDDFLKKIGPFKDTVYKSLSEAD